MGSSEYEIDSVPTKSEIFDLLDKFAEPIRKVYMREVACGYYPTHEQVIYYSKEQYDWHIGPNRQNYEWYDELGCALPTKTRLEYEATTTGVGGLDPDVAVGKIEVQANRRATGLYSSLREAYSGALADVDLEKLANTALGHSRLYDELDALENRHQHTIADLQALGQDWDGTDGKAFRGQYGDVTGVAIRNHSTMALSLRSAADVDLGLQSALHASLWDLLIKGSEGLSELSSVPVLTEDGIKALAAGGIALGLVGLAAEGIAATVITLTGIAVSVLGYKGVEITIDPEISAVANLSTVEEIVIELIDGAGRCIEDLQSARMENHRELETFYSSDVDKIGLPDLIPGTDYFE